MNERIKELAGKVWAEEYWNNPNTDKLLPAQLKKFAELIVQECLLALEPNSYDTEISYDVETKFYLRSAGKIKQHFGVES